MVAKQTPETIINDFEIERVHANANFGSMTKRSVVNDGVLKCALGYSCGHTQIQILEEHGLVRSENTYNPPLTMKGKKYLRSMFRNVPFSKLEGLCNE